MKKVLIGGALVLGLFLSACGENLPKEITQNANFKRCQQVEKNLLSIQSKFEKDDRVEFYESCNLALEYGSKTDKRIFETIEEGEEKFKNVVLELNKRNIKNHESIYDLLGNYAEAKLLLDQKNAPRRDNSYLGKKDTDEKEEKK